MNLPLDRDVSSGDDIIYDEDDSPVDVPNAFREAIRKALKIAESACRKLLSEEKPKRSAVEFWCDTTTSLRRIDKDISIVIERDLAELEKRNGR